MDQLDKQLNNMKQIAMEIIKEEDIIEVKIKKDEIHIKKRKPQDVADKERQRVLDEREKIEADALAKIRLKQIVDRSNKVKNPPGKVAG